MESRCGTVLHGHVGFGHAAEIGREIKSLQFIIKIGLLFIYNSNQVQY